MRLETLKRGIAKSPCLEHTAGHNALRTAMDVRVMDEIQPPR